MTIKIYRDESLLSYDFENSYLNRIRDSLYSEEIQTIENWINENYYNLHRDDLNAIITEDELYDLFEDFDFVWEKILDYAVVKIGNKRYYTRGFFKACDYAKWHEIAEAVEFYGIDIECLEPFFEPDDHEDYCLTDIVDELKNAKDADCLTDEQIKVLTDLNDICYNYSELFTKNELLFLD